MLTLSTLADAPAMAVWFARSLSLPFPPFPPTEAHCLAAIAAGVWLGNSAPDRIRSPIGYWVTMLRGGRLDPPVYNALDAAVAAYREFCDVHYPQLTRSKRTLSAILRKAT